MNRGNVRVALFAVVSALSACGGGGGGSNGQPGSSQDFNNNDQFSEEFSQRNSVGTVNIVGANREALAGAQIQVRPVNQGTVQSSFSSKSAFTVKSDTPLVSGPDGSVNVDELTPGTYEFEATLNGQTSVVEVVIHEQNAEEAIGIILPLSCSETDCNSVDNEAIFASVSGVVFSDDAPVSGAQVSISAGAATGGAYATAITETDGSYTLLVNVSGEFKQDLFNSTISVVADCYEVAQLDVSVGENHLAGANIELFASGCTGTAASGGEFVLFRETFEQDSPTRAGWTVEGGYDESTTWHLHSNGDTSRNTLVPSHTELPPGDDSNGVVPAPGEGNFAYWYGGATNGNYIGEQSLTPEGAEPGADPSTDPNAGPGSDPGAGDPGSAPPPGLGDASDGGMSQSPHYGGLISPSIDLSAASSGTPISLSFMTYWEIESVNPNCQGFDLMTVEVSTDNGESFVPVARLNPLSDPQTGEETNRGRLAYTNSGFNSPAQWLVQEAIPFDDYRGQVVKLRFSFDTVDQLFNGFRGWLIDDVVIAQTEGTFPEFSELQCETPYYQCDGSDGCADESACQGDASGEQCGFPDDSQPPPSSEPGTPDAYEEDDDETQAKVIGNGDVQDRNHADDGFDWATFSLAQAATVELETFNLGPSADTVLELYDHNQNLIAQDDDSGSESLSSRITVNLGPGQYFLLARHYQSSSPSQPNSSGYSLEMNVSQ